MEMRYKRRMYMDSAAIDKFYFRLESKIRPNFHNDNNYDYLMPLWKVACQIYRWKLHKHKTKQ